MRLVAIDEGVIILELHPEECRNLARACRTSAALLSNPGASVVFPVGPGEEVIPLIRYYEDLAAALEGLAIDEEFDNPEAG